MEGEEKLLRWPDILFSILRCEMTREWVQHGEIQFFVAGCIFSFFYWVSYLTHRDRSGIIVDLKVSSDEEFSNSSSKSWKQKVALGFLINYLFATENLRLMLIIVQHKTWLRSSCQMPEWGVECESDGGRCEVIFEGMCHPLRITGPAPGSHWPTEPRGQLDTFRGDIKFVSNLILKL